MSSSPSPSPKICFNSKCSRILLWTRRGWRRRTGDFAQLCDPCAAAYEEGKFCELFHLNDSGWRGCQSCGKQIHCGCIVSFHMFVLLDAGGIECINCTRKTFVLTPNPAWPPPFHVLHGMPDTTKDMSVKQWSSIVASGPVPCRQAPGIKSGEQPNPNLNATQSPFLKNAPVTPYFNMDLNTALTNETSKKTKVCKQHTRWTTPPLAAGKKCCSFSGVNSSCEAQPCDRKLPGDAHGQSHLLPRYRPIINDKEQKPEIPDSIITPLFEKLLTASDARRTGSLVLPKKCAEVHFPPISNPEGIPLLIHDSEGKEWMCQFRFWLNNNSKIYFLEGAHLCMQSMQMQAGDRVTFSRLEPEGKLVMGCRKALSSSDKCKISIVHKNNGGSTHNDSIVETNEAGEVVAVCHHAERYPEASGLFAVKKPVDPTSILSKAGKSSYTATEVLGTKLIMGNKRKYSTLASKYKRQQIENKMVELKVTLEQAQVLFRPPNDAPKTTVIEGYEIEEFEEPPIIGRPTILAEDHRGEKIQWAQCEDCFKWRKLPGEVCFPARWTCSNNLWDPQRSHCSVAQEISSELLKDLLSASNQAGAKKLEAYREELISLVALEGLDALSYLGIKEEGDDIAPSSLATTKHPRHRPGCSCIVCIQPPSGMSPKHEPTCTCNICSTVKCHLETLALRREKKQSENEAETARQKLQQSEQLVNEKIRPYTDAGTRSPSDQMMTDEGHDNDPVNMNSYTSPFKGQIDLNILPEPDEDLSPVSDYGGMIKNVIQDAARS